MYISKGSIDKRYSGVFDQLNYFLGGLETESFYGADNAVVHIGGNYGQTAVTEDSVRNAEVLQFPRDMFNTEVVVNDTGVVFDTTMNLTKEERRAIDRMVTRDMQSNPGRPYKEALVQLLDSMQMMGTFNSRTRQIDVKPFIAGVNDSAFVTRQVPFFNVTYSPVIFEQPMVQGRALNLVKKTRVPNPWANSISFWTGRFEGSARVNAVGSSQLQHNVNLPVKTGSGQIITDLINFMIDWEHVITDHSRFGGLQGNNLSSRIITSQEKYADFALEQLHNILIYFGNPESGFEGLIQQTTEEQWADDSLTEIQNDGSNTSQGVAMIKVWYKFLADLLKDTSFIAEDIVVNCSPDMYAALMFTIGNDQFHLKSPLSILQKNFTDSDLKTMGMPGTQVETIHRLVDQVKFNVDPMLAPNTPMNPYNSDLMFLVMRKLKSDIVMQNNNTVFAPEAISKMVVPTMRGPNRYGNGRTTIKRVGGIVAPYSDTIKVVRGMGVK